MDYIWRHAPQISAQPKEILDFYTKKENGEVFQKAIFLLENNKYLYIMYNGMLDNPNSGITDIEEFDSLSEAEEVFK